MSVQRENMIERDDLQSNLGFLDYHQELKEFLNKLTESLSDQRQLEGLLKCKHQKVKQVLANNFSGPSFIQNIIKEIPLVVFLQLAQLTQNEINFKIHSQEFDNKQEEIKQLKHQVQENSEFSLKYKEEMEQLEKKQKEFEDLIDSLKQKCSVQQQQKEEIQQLNQVLENEIADLHEYREEKEKKNQYQPAKNESEYGYDIIIEMKSVNDLQNSTSEVNQESNSIDTLQDSSDENRKKDISNSMPQELNKNNIIPQGKGLKVQLFNKQINMNLMNVIIVGMQGQRNKGKTFILNSLINEAFPSDFHVSTPGICIKQHTLNNKNIVYIDSEGLNCPVTMDYENNQHYRTFMDNKLNNGIEDVSSQEKLSLDITNRHQDLKATEQIQQEFILENSNILIIVVSHLTLDDQKLIHQISEQFVVDKNNPKQKKLLVVHNLKEYHRPEYVQKYMEDLKLIFPVTELPVNTFQKNEGDESSVVYVDNLKPHINHLVMGYSKSEAGRIYNRFTLYFLRHMIELYQGHINFNIPMKLVEYLNKHLQNYVTLKKESDDVKQNPQIRDFLEFNSEKQAVMLKKGYKIERIKELQVNVFGSLQKDCSYSIVNNDEKKERYLLLEIPGSATFKKKFDKSAGQFIIIISQNNDLELKLGEIQATTRKQDEKYYTIQICKEKELWNIHYDRYQDLQNGIHKFVFTQEIQEDFE